MERKLYGAKEFIGKALSPSCSCSKIYDETHSGKVMDGRGGTTELLLKNGIKLKGEEDL